MPTRRRSAVAAAVCAAILVGATPTRAAPPPGSQPALPLVHEVVSIAQYAPHAATQPLRDRVPLHHPPTSLLLRGTVVTMDDDHHVVPHGNVLVVGSKITAIWPDGSPPQNVDTTGAQVVDGGPDALIFPGLINLHDHPTYDVVPMVPPPASRAVPYADRYEWNRTPPAEFQRLINNTSDALISSDALGLYVDVLKHAETRAILGGETTFQNGSDDAALAGLVRDADHTNFGRDRVESRVASVNDASFSRVAAGLRARMDSGQVDAWLVHLAEGRDAESEQELRRIADLGLLTDATVVVHGTALSAADFAAMRAARRAGRGDGLGAKLVWSPFSNLLLYGQTASVYDALAKGVLVSLGTDWTPSGTNTLLDEMKVADRTLRDPRLLGTTRHLVPALSDETLLDRAVVDMVTRNPALTLRWPEVGEIATGRVADILMIHRPALSPTGGMPASPYRSLIDATPRDIDLVLVGGKPLAGAVATLHQLRGDDFEVVTSVAGRYKLAVDVTVPDIPRGRERLATVEGHLRQAMQALGGNGTTFPYLRQHFDGGRYALTDDAAFRDQVLAPRYGRVGGRVNLASLQLHPLLTDDDQHFFTVAGGLADEPRPPYAPYRTSLFFIHVDGNPFGAEVFAKRWWT